MPEKPAFGFTLIEILVTISLIGILSSVGIASYIGFSRSQQVLQTARKVVQDLRLAQSMAANNQKPQSPALCGTLSGYTFRISGNNYYIDVNCLNPVYDNLYRTDTIPSGFTHTGFNKVFFQILNRGITCTPNADPCQLTINGNNLSKIVNVGTGGAIKIVGE